MTSSPSETAWSGSNSCSWSRASPVACTGRPARRWRTGALALKVAPGPRVAIEFAGHDAASTFGTRFGRSGTEAYSTNNALRTASMHSREWLMSDNYLQAKIDYEIEEVGDRQRQVRQIQPGERSQKWCSRSRNASAVDPDDLNKIIAERQRLERSSSPIRSWSPNCWSSTTGNKDTLSAEIDEPRYERQNAIARVVLPVRGNPRFTVARVTLRQWRVSRRRADFQLYIVAGEPCAPAAESALDKIRDLYWDKGYNDVSPTTTSLSTVVLVK